MDAVALKNTALEMRMDNYSVNGRHWLTVVKYYWCIAITYTTDVFEYDLILGLEYKWHK